MKQRIQGFVIALFFVFTFAVLVWFNMAKPRVLILHSYNPEYSWTHDLQVGIDRVLHDKTNYYIRTFYLDTKRHPWPEYKKSIGTVARRMIKEWHPDVVIASDDDAQNFVMRHFVNDPEVRVVFCGVNRTREDYGYDKADNVTGILERLPLEAVKDSMFTYWERSGRKGPVRLIFLGDDSETVVGDSNWVKEYDWSPAILSDVVLVNNFDDWKQAVKDAPGNADFIVVSNYRRVARVKDSKDIVPAGELIEWTETNSEIPILGTNAFYPEDGGMLAVATSPFEQGEVAARMAVQIIDDDVKPRGIPVQITSQFLVSMSRSRVAKRNFTLPLVYRASAQASDKYYE